jgi:hypothetical protein
MRSHAARSSLHPDYYVIANPRPDGPVIGSFAGCPVAAAVIDFLGRRFVYAGIAPRRPTGQYRVESLKEGEWIVEPGLIYVADVGADISGDDAVPGHAAILGPDLT